MCDREIDEVEPLQELLDVWLQMKPYSPWDGFVVKAQQLLRSSQIFDWTFFLYFLQKFVVRWVLLCAVDRIIHMKSNGLC